jgi:di/tricarboxylate transporter
MAGIHATSRRTVPGLAAALLLPGLLTRLPAPAGLYGAGQRNGALFLAALILWATEALPVEVTALLAVLMQPVLGAQEGGAPGGGGEPPSPDEDR